MRWAVFKDVRGVAYCEPVNEGIDVYVKNVPGKPEKRNLLGKVTQGATAPEMKIKARLKEEFYSPSDYYASAFERPDATWTLDANRRYLKENRWGPVLVILFIVNDKLGRRMQYEFRRLAPEGELYDLGKKRDLKAKPHPETDRIIEKLRVVV